jgi:hypothetical protein
MCHEHGPPGSPGAVRTAEGAGQAAVRGTLNGGQIFGHAPRVARWSGAAASLTASLSGALKREFGVSPGAYRRSTGRLGA